MKKKQKDVQEILDLFYDKYHSSDLDGASSRDFSGIAELDDDFVVYQIEYDLDDDLEPVVTKCLIKYLCEEDYNELKYALEDSGWKNG